MNYINANRPLHLKLLRNAYKPFRLPIGENAEPHRPHDNLFITLQAVEKLGSKGVRKLGGPKVSGGQI